MFFLMIGIVNLTERYAWAAIIAGAVFLLIEIRYLSRVPNPILNVSIFRNRGFSAS